MTDTPSSAASAGLKDEPSLDVLAAAARDLEQILKADSRLRSLRWSFEYAHEDGESDAVGFDTSVVGDADYADAVSHELYVLAAEVERRHGLPRLTIGIVVFCQD